MSYQSPIKNVERGYTHQLDIRHFGISGTMFKRSLKQHLGTPKAQ